MPKLPEVDLFLKRDQVRHKKFFTEDNSCRYLPPFLVVTKKRVSTTPELGESTEEKVGEEAANDIP